MTLVRLFVLGLLREGPRHGYDLHRWLEQSRADLWADILPGSIYHALRQMEREGLVVVEATERAGNRTRAVYAITAAGREAYDWLLREGWQQPRPAFPAALYTLLTFGDHLPAPFLREAVQGQIAALEREVAAWDEGEAAKERYGVLPPWGRAMFDNGRAHLDADLRLLRAVLARLDEA